MMSCIRRAAGDHQGSTGERLQGISSQAHEDDSAGGIICGDKDIRHLVVHYDRRTSYRRGASCALALANAPQMTNRLTTGTHTHYDVYVSEYLHIYEMRATRR